MKKFLSLVLALVMIMSLVTISTGAKEFTDDDAYLVNVADGEIQIMAPAEVAEDTEITAFKKESSVTVDGTKYSYAATAEYDGEVLDKYASTTAPVFSLFPLNVSIKIRPS